MTAHPANTKSSKHGHVAQELDPKKEDANDEPPSPRQNIQQDNQSTSPARPIGHTSFSAAYEDSDGGEGSEGVENNTAEDVVIDIDSSVSGSEGVENNIIDDVVIDINSSVSGEDDKDGEDVDGNDQTIGVPTPGVSKSQFKLCIYHTFTNINSRSSY